MAALYQTLHYKMKAAKKLNFVREWLQSINKWLVYNNFINKTNHISGQACFLVSRLMVNRQRKFFSVLALFLLTVWFCIRLIPGFLVFEIKAVQTINK